MVDTSARLYSVLKVPVLGSSDLRVVFFEVIKQMQLVPLGL
jgi:hypothetical protein